jgi:hypothetical protein
MSVPLEGERRGGVAGDGLEVSYWLPTARQQAQATMPQVVEPDRGQPRPLQKRLEAPVYDVLGFEGRPLRVALCTVCL